MKYKALCCITHRQKNTKRQKNVIFIKRTIEGYRKRKGGNSQIENPCSVFLTSPLMFKFPFPLENFKAIEARVMNVLITAVDFRAEQRKRNQTKESQRATKR